MVEAVQALRQCLNAHRILFPDRIETMIRVAVNSGIDLVSSRIHDRADKFVSIPDIVRDCRRRWNGNQWFFKCQTKSLGCCRTDAKTGKRARTSGNCNRIDRRKIQLCHVRDFIQHRKQSLGMCFFIIYGVFRKQCVIFNNSHRSHQAGAVQCKYFHSFLFPFRYFLPVQLILAVCRKQESLRFPFVFPPHSGFFSFIPP